VSDASADSLKEAMASEEALTIKAKELWEKHDGPLDRGLFNQLYPLLCEPIPSAYIQAVPKLEKGKPYASKGVRSVQVQIDRMNNVLGPCEWGYTEDFEENGKVATVTVFVGSEEQPLLRRSSRGGVDRGSSTGNVYKGSFTNAAKLAFARVGPGHEVYVGAADLDPDVNDEVAQASASEKPVDPSKIGKDIAQKLVDRAFAIKAAKSNFQLAASHAADRDVGPAGSKAAAVKATAGLTFPEAEKLERWIAKKEQEANG
jgi:hypothetical protein